MSFGIYIVGLLALIGGLLWAAVILHFAPQWIGDSSERAADLSVGSPPLVDHYWTAHEFAMPEGRGQATTEELRQAIDHYGTLFASLEEFRAAQLGEFDNDLERRLELIDVTKHVDSAESLTRLRRKSEQRRMQLVWPDLSSPPRQLWTSTTSGTTL